MPTGSASAVRKPRRLRAGDRIAIISPSWGGPAQFSDIYNLGLQVLRDVLELQPVEYPTARMTPDMLQTHPEARAADVNAAFADNSISGIIASIGGDDSVRILKHLSNRVIIEHPKLLMGFSDFTTLLTYVNILGNVTIHGPSVMAGLAQAASLGSEYIEHLRTFLFGDWQHLPYRPYPNYSAGYPDWSVPENLGKTHPPTANRGWDWAQSAETRAGRLWGGCMDVLEFMKGTDFWPERSFFDDKILFLETSEEKPSPVIVERWLRNYGMQTILNRVHGVIFGRPNGYSEEQKEQLRRVVLRIITEEFGCKDIPIILDFDAGHTDPQRIVPFGILARIDSAKREISLIESAFDAS